MQRITTATKKLNKFGAAKHGFTSGNVNSQIGATQLSADWFDGVQEEIANVVEFSGQTLNSADKQQLAKSIPYMAGHPAPSSLEDVHFEWKSEIEPPIPTFYKLITGSARIVGSNSAVLCVFDPPNNSVGTCEITTIVAKDDDFNIRSQSVHLRDWRKTNGFANYTGPHVTIKPTAGNWIESLMDDEGGSLYISVLLYDVTGNFNVFVKCEYTGVYISLGDV